MAATILDFESSLPACCGGGEWRTQIMQHAYKQLFSSRYSQMVDITPKSWVATLDPNIQLSEDHFTRTLGRAFIVARLARTKKYSKTQLHLVKKLLNDSKMELYRDTAGAYYIVHDHTIPDYAFYKMKAEMLNQKTARDAAELFARLKEEAYTRVKMLMGGVEPIAEFVMTVTLDDLTVTSETELTRTYNATKEPFCIHTERCEVRAIAFGKTPVEMHNAWDPLPQHDLKWTAIFIQH